MTILSSHDLGPRLLKALGLEGRQVTKLNIAVSVDGVPHLHYTEYLAPNVTNNVSECLTTEQGENLVQTVAGASASPIPVSTVAVIDGPAERLARAVLAGDVKSALVLADYVQEVWSVRHTGS